ncbi:MAG: hypothetical protein AAFQ51_17850, partial [Pseudomonadota bacterium]
ATANFTLAAAHGVSLSKVDVTQAQVNSMFGDRATVQLPEGIEMPAHWGAFDDYGAFYEAWRAEKAKRGLAD